MIERRPIADGLVYVAEQLDLVTTGLSAPAQQGLAIALRQHATELREFAATLHEAATAHPLDIDQIALTAIAARLTDDLLA